MTASARMLPVDRWRRPLVVALTVLTFAGAAVVWVIRLGVVIREGAVAIDFRLWLVIAKRWVETGSMYTADQLAGPFDPQPMDWITMADLPTLYPPPAILLFLPFLVLPAILWWVIPLGSIVLVMTRLRPASWTWPVIGAILMWPEVSTSIYVGSTTMWIVAFLALGLVYHWPSTLILLKPSLAPFALVGIRHRSWWLGLGVWCLVAVLMLPAWLDYLTVARNVDSGLLYSIGSIPFMLVPVVAWLGRRRDAPETVSASGATAPST